MSTVRVAEVTAAWRAAGERGNSHAAARCLADNAEMISPLTGQFRFHGRAQVHELLVSAFQVISDVRYHTEVGDGATRALFFHGRCAGQEFEEAQLLRFDAEGRIGQLTLFGRPLPGVTAVMAGIGPRLVRRQGRPVLAVVVGAAVTPMAAVTRLGDRHVVPRTDPNGR